MDIAPDCSGEQADYWCACDRSLNVVVTLFRLALVRTNPCTVQSYTLLCDPADSPLTGRYPSIYAPRCLPH